MKHIILILIFLKITFSSLAQTKGSTVKNNAIINDQECPHLVFRIGNGMSRMPAIAFKNSIEASIEMSDMTKSDYNLQKFTITILSNETNTFKTFTNEGNIFTEKTKELLSTLKPKDTIIVSGIAVVDASGNTKYIQERSFGVY